MENKKIVEETLNMLKNGVPGDEEVYTDIERRLRSLNGNTADECVVEWDGEEITSLDIVLNEYREGILESVVNYIEALQEEEE